MIGQEESIIMPNETENTEKKDNASDEGTSEVEIVKNSANLVVEKRERNTSVTVYHDADGNPLEKNIMDNITQFQVSKT